MEVSGKKLQRDASSLDETYCQPCSQDGETLPAEAFCTVCKEFMCSTCTKVHMKQKMTKSHALLDKSIMPTTMTDHSNKQRSTEPCDIHPEDIIRYFCPTHQSLNCGHCLATEHRACHVDIISDVSEAFKDGLEYENFNKSIAQLIKDIESCDADVKTKVQFITKLGEDEVAKLREYRDKVNKYFDERELSLLSIIEGINNMDKTRLTSLKTKCDNLKVNVEDIKSKLTSLETDTVQLFIEVKRAQKQVESLQSALADTNKKMIIHNYRFRKDTATEGLLSSSTGLGTVDEIMSESLPSSEQATEMLAQMADVTVKGSKPRSKLFGEWFSAVIHSQDSSGSGVQAVASVDMTKLKFIAAPSISVMSKSDFAYCNRLCSMILLPGDRMLISDLSNHAVKQIDLQTGCLVNQVRVPAIPFDMCLLPRDRVAVGLYGSIQFLHTQGPLAIVDNVKVSGSCRVVGFHNDSLIVIYFSGKVEIMDMGGNVIKRIDKLDMFDTPRCLTVFSEDQKAVVFISDCGNSNIYKLDMDLNILQVFRDPALRGPEGITAVGNQLIICGGKSNNIMCMDISSVQFSQLLGEKDGIQGPKSILYNEHMNRLYVTRMSESENTASNESVNVYEAVCG